MTTEALRSRCHWYRCLLCQQYCLCSDWRAFDLKTAAWGTDYAEALISLLEAEVLNQENAKGFWCGCCCVRHRLCRKRWSFWVKKLVLKYTDSKPSFGVRIDTSLPGKRWAVNRPLFFGEPVHQETLEPEENNHLVSGIKKHQDAQFQPYLAERK